MLLLMMKLFIHSISCHTSRIKSAGPLVNGKFAIVFPDSVSEQPRLLSFDSEDPRADEFPIPMLEPAGN